MEIQKIKYFASILLIIFLTACEEVIDIDLNSSNPVLVAEGEIENESPAWIRLTYTTDYFETEQAKVEDEATVIISDAAGNTEILEYIGNGYYEGTKLIGIINSKYTLSILKGDEEFEASAILFPPSEILSVGFEKSDMVKPGHDESYSITVNFSDDPSVRNYYLFQYIVNGEVETNNYYLVDDNYYETTGNIEYSPLRPDFKHGDEVFIKLYSIDKDTYVYYSELNDGSEGMMGGSSTPYNPRSNFGSEVMGYFVAWSKVEFATIVE